MRKPLLLPILLAFSGLATDAMAQGPLLTSWIMNVNGTYASYWQNNGTPNNPSFTFVNTTDSADVLNRCFDNDFVYIRSHGMTVNMGQFTNPGTPVAQNKIWKFPRDTMPSSNPTNTSAVGAIGVLLNGIPIFGKGDGRSWNSATQQNENMGQGIWNGEAMYGEGASLDTAFSAHPQMSGVYHTHGTPHRLYPFPSTAHSPIVGYAFDGYPIYGPYGYSSPYDPNSSIVQITSSFQHRNITQRHSLPDGTVLQANQYGPDVSPQHPLGEYIEDFEYVPGLGMLDDHNGRYCVTPEYPNGTYAYFVTATANDEPVHPYFIGPTYFGVPEMDNIGPTSNIMIPPGADCQLPVGLEVDRLLQEIQPSPNPFQGRLKVDFAGLPVDEIQIVDLFGKTVYQQSNPGSVLEIQTSEWSSGFYSLIIVSGEVVASKMVSLQR